MFKCINPFHEELCEKELTISSAALHSSEY